MDFPAPTTPPFSNDGTLVEFPQDSQQNMRTLGSISGTDDDDNTDDDVNWEVTSKIQAHQAATGRSETTLEATRLDSKLSTRFGGASYIELIVKNWKNHYCNCSH